MIGVYSQMSMFLYVYIYVYSITSAEILPSLKILADDTDGDVAYYASELIKSCA